MAPRKRLTPIHFFSHGSPMMLIETTESSEYWRRCGEEALASNIKGIIIMSAHWTNHTPNTISIATNPDPKLLPIPFVPPTTLTESPLTPDLPTATRCAHLLRTAGIAIHQDSTYNWIHDTYQILLKMFPPLLKGGDSGASCPPVTVLSTNAHFDPYFHLRIGITLRPLRHENYLLIGTGGAVHNLYRNRWGPMLRYQDTLAMETPPEPWALEFRTAVEDALTKTSGPRLRRAVTRLMKHPLYREAHATDEHFMPAVFVAGAAGDWEDEDAQAVMGAETWELTNMCNSQFTVGC
ncbi:DODA-type extradiol aromatic ring-opening family dioxygenase [Aspergillus saccharolyticus JOP 1030-1]|uniref:Catalytic LigB subunit of aromatic ring-opening dioxygenase n=1 Tax=Aspergillus saccharolyticus JOP 1030-1 TaxID=1450539 RepID=A0A318ZPJ1_9EURO|nr:catalytic LigB subunit of aromatic ring-opening dioxygenase [Aspergillus saccharolyticus JOP 1030-1]PYH48927.1 catalytic LigB subunit of aromatic ring-opening dioxygenase [Aspergillus saccharolyticus JOP 1030-1]